jgi:hypothetical protein
VREVVSVWSAMSSPTARLPVDLSTTPAGSYRPYSNEFVVRRIAPVNADLAQGFCKGSNVKYQPECSPWQNVFLFLRRLRVLREPGPAGRQTTGRGSL